MNFPATQTIERIARAFASPMSRRRVAGLVAAGLVAGAGAPVVARAADDCGGCNPGEICNAGICSVIVEDGCEAFGCSDGQQCVAGLCRAPKSGAAARRRRRKQARRA